MDGNDEVGVVELGGRINITTDDEIGILSTGTGASIINRGTINSTGSNSDGIYSGGIGASISNTGAIFTYGLGARGISSTETDATIINSGNINTTGFGGFGIETIGSNAIIMNKGDIETVGESAYGIVSRGVNVVITNDGLISTTGFQARAIESLAQNAYITNNGNIKTTGQSSHGINMASADGRIINRGSIFTSGDGSIGVNSSMVGSTLFNFGEIATSGISFADAVVMSGANSSVTNYGKIAVSGDISFALVMSGADSTVTNYGQIAASSGSTYAILGGNGKQTVNIMPGSRITGRINLEGTGDDDQVNFYGFDGSASITVESSEFINILNSNATQIGNKILYIDPSIYAFSRRNLNSMTTAAHSSVAQRFTGVSPSRSTGPIKTNQITNPQGDSTLWANTFIQKDQRDPEEHIQAYESYLTGVVIGHELVDKVSPLGIFGGMAKSDTNSSRNGRQSDSFFFGVHGRHDVNSIQLSASMLLGYREHQLQRQVLDNLNGLMTASSRTSGLFVSPSLSISSTNTKLGSFGIQPSATITYSLERVNGYSETGANQSNFLFGQQKIEALSTRLQLEKTQTMSGGEFIVRAGVHSRNTRSRDVVSSINGTEFTINSQSEDRTVGLFAGVQADTRLTGSLRLKLTADYGDMGGGERFSNVSVAIFAPI